MSERVYPRESPPVSGDHSTSKPPPIYDSPPLSGQHHPKLIVDSPPVSGQHHPKLIVDSPPVSGQHHRPTNSQDSFTSSKFSYPYNSGPQPGTYVVQVPKDQIYRVPPPENAHKFKLYTQKKSRRHRCRYCFCSILILAVLATVAAALFYLICRPKALTYSIDGVDVKGVNLSVGPTFPPCVTSLSKQKTPMAKLEFTTSQEAPLRFTMTGLISVTD